MTRIGDSFASQISNSPTNGLKVLYYMRRNKGKTSDVQLQEHVIPDKYELQTTIQRLIRENAIVEIGKG